MEAIRRLGATLNHFQRYQQQNRQQQQQQQHSSQDIAQQHDSGAAQHQERYKRSSWPATAVLQRPAPPPPFLHWCDKKLLAGVLCILLLCWLGIANDHGAAPQLTTTTAHMGSPASISYISIEVRSSVLDVDPVGEVVVVQFSVQQQGAAVAAACQAGNAAEFELAVGTAVPAGARPAAVLPLCPKLASVTEPAGSTAAANSSSSGVGGGDSSSSSGDELYAVYTVALPARKTNMLESPWEELAADIKLQLQCDGLPCSARNTPGVLWTSHWASPKMHMAVERHMLVAAVPVLHAAGAYPIDEGSIAFMEALGVHRPTPVATMQVLIQRHAGVRILQLLVAATQVGFITYCLVMGVGRVLWAYVMSRFLSMRLHMARSRRTTAE